mgnify:CR=1 FL=1
MAIGIGLLGLLAVGEAPGFAAWAGGAFALVLVGRGIESVDVLLQVASVVLVACAAVLLVAAWRPVVGLGWPSLLAFAGFTLAVMLSGHLLGGPDPAGRTSLAVACATRRNNASLVTECAWA